ncbi:MAG: hypothetical protein LC660_05900 [Desulfobacteraceae bacterium]|nr:hypothetical protein [Desulfobacteraceae bacterium]
MLRENNKILVRLQRTCDLAITAASFVAAYYIKRNMLPAGMSGLTVFKWGVIQTLRRLRAKGYNTRHVLVVGSQTRAAACP